MSQLSNAATPAVVLRALMVVAMLLPPVQAATIPPLPAVTHAGWQEKCGDCHMLYHPGLLPARSWQRLMDGMKNHFGRNVGMDATLRADITSFLLDNAADRVNHSLSQSIVKSLSASDRPTRISTTKWFDATHANIRKVEHFSHCVVCHRNAAAGDFEVAH